MELVIMPALVIIIMIALLAFLYLVLITLVSFYKDTDVSISLTNSFSEVATRFEFSTIVYIIVAFNIIFIINAMVFSNAFSMFVLQNLSLYFVGYSNLFVLIFRTLQRFFYNLFFFSNPVFLIVQLTILFLVLISVGFHGFAFELLLVIETNDFSVILEQYKPLLRTIYPGHFLNRSSEIIPLDPALLDDLLRSSLNSRPSYNIPVLDESIEPEHFAELEPRSSETESTQLEPRSSEPANSDLKAVDPKSQSLNSLDKAAIAVTIAYLIAAALFWFFGK
jgi:hypothetical protein